MNETENIRKSPYRALTDCTFHYYEMNRVLPLLMAENAEEAIKDEIQNNRVMMVNSIVSRKKFMNHYRHRFNAVPRSFWSWYITLDEQAQKAALLFVILKTYRLFFDLHFNVTVGQWNSVSQSLGYDEVHMEMNEIASRDETVDAWSDETKHRTISSYLTILRQAGLLEEKTGKLHPIKLQPSDYAYYLRNGEEWFLDACLLARYEIKDIIANI